jgi:hypothetical protein
MQHTMHACNVGSRYPQPQLNSGTTMQLAVTQVLLRVFFNANSVLQYHNKKACSLFISNPQSL